MCTHRGGLGATTGAGAGAATAGGAGGASTAAEPAISEFYQNQLNQLAAAIRNAQMRASLAVSPNASPAYRRRIANARRQLQQLERDYDALEQVARADARRRAAAGGGF